MNKSLPSISLVTEGRFCDMAVWTLVLSIIGALAWIPIIITPIINALRRVHASLFEGRVLSNGKAIPAGAQEAKEGTILLLCLDMYLKNVDFFPTEISAKITLTSGTTSNAILLDCSTVIANSSDGTKSRFRIPLDMEWNVSRTIHKNSDNIKIVAFLVENASFQNLYDIETIEIVLHSSKLCGKNFKICNTKFPRFNAPFVLSKYEEALCDDADAEVSKRYESV